MELRGEDERSGDATFHYVCIWKMSGTYLSFPFMLLRSDSRSWLDVVKKWSWLDYLELIKFRWTTFSLILLVLHYIVLTKNDRLGTKKLVHF